MNPILPRSEFGIREVCHVLDVSESTLRRMIAAHEFPPADGQRGAKSFWTFATVAGYVQQRIAGEYKRLYALEDHLDKTAEKIARAPVRQHRIDHQPWYYRLLMRFVRRT